MNSKVTKTFLWICSISVVAALAAFGLWRMSQGKTTPVVVFSEQERAEFERSIVREYQDIDPLLLERTVNMKPIVRLGPLVILFDESNGDYAVYDERDPIAVRTTDDEGMSMTYLGKRGEVSANVTLTYRTGTNHLKQIEFATSESGPFGPIRYLYADQDGDGRFERFVDVEARKSYVLKDLEWVPIDSTQPKDK